MNGSSKDYPKITCPDCGLTYIDDSDWSGDAHSIRDCRDEWKRRALFAESKLTRLSKLSKHPRNIYFCGMKYGIPF